MQLHIAPNQVQTISPQMAQAMEVLQMNALELKSYVEEISTENPVIDLGEPVFSGASVVELHKLQWLESKRQERAQSDEPVWESDEDGDLTKLSGRQSPPEETLAFFLKAQLYAMRLQKETERAAVWVVDNLDSNGWYTRDGGDLPYSGKILLQAIDAVQKLEPAGVGANGLRECLLLQLQRLDGDYRLEIEIIEKYLEELGKDHYNNIAKKIGVSQQFVREACERIRSLNPRPGAAFDSGDDTEYIQPDIIVADLGDHFEVTFLEQGVPELRLNPYYCRLAKETEDPSVREYLENKARQAKWLIQSIQQRKDTVRRCVELILDCQKEFFKGSGRLLPLTMKDVAALAEVHESTVSRAVRGKYLQCDRGVFPLSGFFSRSVSGAGQESVTKEYAKELLGRLIEQESGENPLSDQKLQEMLLEEGVEISRRTVAKYRIEMGVPPATGRRKV